MRVDTFLALLLFVSLAALVGVFIIYNQEISVQYQTVNMTVDSYGYTPNTFTIKVGVPVKWRITVNEVTGCNRYLVMEEYGIDKEIYKGTNNVYFTPTTTGMLEFHCNMNMIKGKFIVK